MGDSKPTQNVSVAWRGVRVWLRGARLSLRRERLSLVQMGAVGSAEAHLSATHSTRTATPIRYHANGASVQRERR
jgi:hypothetical protein